MAHDLLVVARHQRLLLVGGMMGDDGAVLGDRVLFDLHVMLLGAAGLVQFLRIGQIALADVVLLGAGGGVAGAAVGLQLLFIAGDLALLDRDDRVVVPDFAAVAAHHL